MMCLFPSVGAVLIILVLVTMPPKPPLALSFLGFETNVFAGLKIDLPADETMIFARLHLTNSGSCSVTFTTDFNHPVYSTLIQTNGAWKEYAYSTFCGAGIGERTLRRGESLIFAVLVKPGASLRIGVPYRTPDLKQKIRRFLPAWVVNHVTWLTREPKVTSPTINLPPSLHDA